MFCRTQKITVTKTTLETSLNCFAKISNIEPTVNKFLLGISEALDRCVARIGSNYECYCCQQRIGRFLTYRGGTKSIPSAMIELDVIGSDVDHFSCPYCRAHDRERHLLMYLDKTSLWKKFKDGAVLHFAPERNLAERIRNSGLITYVKADLFPASLDIVREDITKLSFIDEVFDIVIANHILEHVPDDAAALREIFRVLKPGGIAILQTPFSSKLTATSEDCMITSAAERLKAYGQEDHVRLYGNDLFVRIEGAGFLPLVQTHEQVLGGIDAKRYGVNPREPFFCYQKPFDPD